MHSTITPRHAAAAIALAATCAISLAHAEPIVAYWSAPVSGRWSDALRWHIDAVPNNTGTEIDSPTVQTTYSAIIEAFGAPYTVEIDDDITLQDFTLQTDDAAFRVLAGSRLRVRGVGNIFSSSQGVGGVVNAGLIEVSGPDASMTMRHVVNDGQIVADGASLSMSRGANNGEVRVNNGSLRIFDVDGSGLYHATQSEVRLVGQGPQQYTLDDLSRITRDRSPLIINAFVDLLDGTLHLDEQAGSIRLDWGGLHNGTVLASRDADGELPSMLVTGNGSSIDDVRFAANIHAQGQLTLTESVSFEGDRITTSAGLFLGFETIDFDIDLLGFSADLYILNSARLTEDATIRINGAFASGLSGDFLNDGTLIVESRDVTLFPSIRNLHARPGDAEYALVGGSWEVVNGGSLYLTQPLNDRTVFPRIVENDARILLAGAGAEIEALADLRRNLGSITIRDAASLALTGDAFTNEGELTLTSDASLTVSESMTNDSEGLIAISLIAPPGAHPLITVADTATLGGTLSLSIDFTPTEHAEYTLIDAATRVGKFESVVVDPSLAPFFDSLVYTDRGLLLRVVPVGAVPTPASGLLVALGAARFARRKR